MAVPIIESVSSAAPGGGATTFSVPAPSSVSAGDVLVAFIGGAYASGTPVVSLSGWTSRAITYAGARCHAVLTRVAGGSEPTDYVFESDISLSARRGIILRASGVDNTNPLNGTLTTNTGTGTTATATGLTTTVDDCLMVYGAGWTTNSATFTPASMTLQAGINRMGAASVVQATAGASGDKEATITSATWTAILLALAPQTAAPNLPPTVALNTADESELSATPTLEFTGTDADEDDITYRVSIADNADFANATVVTEELTSGSGTVIHPNPQGGTTWEGHRQVDDRLGMAFQGSGGILDSVDYRFGPHESLPELTDGDYLARVYEAEGYPVDPVPAIWVASTAYTANTVIRPTSGANANVHFVYRCTVAGTSATTEPAWPGNGVDWQSITPGQTLTDGGVTWEALPGLHPVNPAAHTSTPTGGWLAQSTIYAYAPGVADRGWKTLAFTGANRIRLQVGKWYMVILDWRPNSDNADNTLAVDNASLAAAVSPGNVYLDGPGTVNNGPRIIDDSWHRIREVQEAITRDSNTHAGFENTVNGADTDPFTSGQQIAFTVQAADELDAWSYYWRVRGADPAGTDSFGDWSGVRTFTVLESVDHPVVPTGLVTGAPTLGSPAVSQTHAVTAVGLVTGTPTLGSPAITQTHAVTTVGLVTDAPTLGQPAVSQPVDNSVIAIGLVTGQPTLGSPAITQTHAVTPTGLVTNQPTLGTPAVSQTHAVVATGLVTGAPTLGTPVISQTHAVAAAGIVTGAPTLGVLTIGQTHAVTATGIVTGAPTLATPIVFQPAANEVMPTGLVAGTPVLSQPIVSNVVTLARRIPMLAGPF